MDEIIRRLLAWRSGKELGPVNLQLNPTDHCNLKCVFCWQRDETKVCYDNELSDERYLRLIDEAKAMGVQRIQITGGGEPFCRRDLVMELASRIKKNGISGSIITNGTLITKEDAGLLAACGWDEIIVSLDGLEESHDLLRGVTGSFRRTCESIRKIQAAKRGELPKVCVHYVLTAMNYEDITELLMLMVSMDVRNFFVEPLVQVAFNTDTQERLKLRGEDLEKFRRQLRDSIAYCEKNHIETNLYSFTEPDLISKTNRMDDVIRTSKDAQDPLLSVPCYEPWYNVIVRPNGRVGPCCMFDYSGEYLSKKTLKDIWLGSFFTRTREGLMRGELPGYCSKCNPSQVVGNSKIREHLGRHMK